MAGIPSQATLSRIAPTQLCTGAINDIAEEDEALASRRFWLRPCAKGTDGVRLRVENGIRPKGGLGPCLSLFHFSGAIHPG